MLDTEWNFYQTSFSEKDRIIEVQSAIENIDEREDFAFYDMHFTEAEKLTLSQVEIVDFNDYTVDSSQTYITKEGISEILNDFINISEGENLIESLANLITRLASNILAATENKNIELKIRTSKEYMSKCPSWHIDKNHYEMNENNLKENLFILPLIGNQTLFTHSTNHQKSSFMQAANDTPLFLGYMNGEYCTDKDEINKIFNDTDIQKAPIGYGSVHLRGKMGTIHSEPIKSNSRMLLLITPF